MRRGLAPLLIAGHASRMPLPTPQKREGAAIVEWVLGMDAMEAPEGPHDYELRRGGEVAGAVCVATLRPASPPASYPMACAAPNLRRSWVLDVEAGVQLLGHHAEVRRLLAALEDFGIWRFGPGAATPPAAFARLGVVAGTGLETSSYPPVVRLAAPPGDKSAPQMLNGQVERHAWLEQTRAALRQAAGAHHLFLWIAEGDLAARAVMEAGDPPPPPVVPSEVTTVWLARRGPATGPLLADRLWQTDERGEWDALGAVRRRTSLRRPPVATAAAGVRRVVHH